MDRDEPQHVHVERDGKQAKYWLVPYVRLARQNGFRPHQLNEIGKIIENHGGQIAEAWRALFNR